MKILFACGGTAGHINPALTTAQTVLGHHPDAEIRFVGNPHGMEARLVKKAGFRFSPVVIQGFYRSFAPKAMAHNASAVYHMLAASGSVRRILREFEPDIVMGTGGYVSGPVLRTAAKAGYRTLTHEQNAFPGVTTKLLAKYVDRILLAVPEAGQYLPASCETVIVGNPVREELVFADGDRCRRAMKIPPERLVLLTFGGSLGAQRINETIADVVAWHYKTGKFHHIHATGQYGVELFPRLLRERGADVAGLPYIDIREYIDDMPQCMAASDLVICRAGAITLSELQAAGKASILVPSPNVAENHQYHNAMVLQNRGAAIVIEEKELTGERLCQILGELAGDRARLHRLSRSAASLAIVDAGERIYTEMMKLLDAPKP